MIKTLIKGYLFRLFPAIIGLGGALFEIPEVFYVGGILCLAIHIILFFRESLKPVLFIIGIYLGAFLLLLNFTGILWGAIISTFFEMVYNGIKTYLAIRTIKKLESRPIAAIETEKKPFVATKIQEKPVDDQKIEEETLDIDKIQSEMYNQYRRRRSKNDE